MSEPLTTIELLRRNIKSICFLLLSNGKSFVSLLGKYVRSTWPSQIFQLRKSHRKTRMLQVIPERARRLTPKEIRLTEKKQPLSFNGLKVRAERAIDI